MIKSVYIESFGGIKNRKIIFSNGVNVIYGDNEAGKSTICAFIKAMLYGMDNSRRADIRTVARKRYMPLDGVCMSGSMEISHYKISRTFGKTAKDDTVNVIDTDTGESVGPDIGKKILGIGEKAFSELLFMESYNPQISSDKEIIGGLLEPDANSSEQRPYDMAVKLIEAERRKISGRKGIVQLEDEVRQTRENAVAAENDYKEYNNALRQLGEKRDEYAQLCERKEYLDELIKQVELSKKHRELLGLNEECDVLRNEIKEHIYIINQESEIPTPYKLSEMLKECKKARRLNIYYIFAIILAILSLAGFLGIIYKMAYLLFSLTAVSALLFFVGWRIRKTKITAAEEKIAAVYERYGVNNATEYEYEYNVRSEQRQLSLFKLNEMLKSKQAVVESIEHELDGVEIDEDITDFYNENDIKTEYEQIAEKINQCEKDILILENKTECAAVSPDELYRRLEVKEKELDEMRSRERCLQIVSEVFEEAFSELQSGFMPRLKKRISEIFCCITDKKYEEVIVSSDLDLSVIGERNILGSSYLSNGTLDALYLSLRLALWDLVFDGTDSFIFMDDAFIQYDDKRAKKAMDCLKTLGTQVLYFTCQKRFDKNIDLA